MLRKLTVLLIYASICRFVKLFCPHCSELIYRIHDYRVKILRDLPVQEKACGSTTGGVTFALSAARSSTSLSHWLVRIAHYCALGSIARLTVPLNAAV